MIKRFVFARKASSLGTADFEARWLDVLAHSAARAPAAVRPVRAVLCTALQLDSEPMHAGVSIEWFTDLDALGRHKSWERQRPPPLAASSSATSQVIAAELVLRGADWLDRRWLTREPKYKHMALARRAPGLTAAEFSERWRNRPGRVGGGQTASLAIPEAAKGRAYCQNHPLSTDIDPEYDAINEVYFDQLADMRPRLDFFRDQPVAQLDADLVSEPRFMVVREQLV